MNTQLKYTATDLARHTLDPDAVRPGALADFLADHLGPELRELHAADAVAFTCAVGYGGHYFEVLEDAVEGDIIDELAEHLAPLYAMGVAQAYELLEKVRMEYCVRLLMAAGKVRMDWAAQGHVVEEVRQNLDDCPLCGRRVLDGDGAGCEAPDGQRWCVDHALEALSGYRTFSRMSNAT